MTGIAVVVVAGALVVYLWHRTEPLIARGLALRERQVESEVEAAKPQPQPEPTKREALPPTLVMIANEWNDPWAREQAMDVFCELYDATGSWDKVLTVALSDQARYLQEKGQLS